jgi:hypothetical protein
MPRFVTTSVLFIALIVLNRSHCQGIRRLALDYGGIGRRADNCSAAGCEFCAAALRLEWVKTVVDAPIPYLTIIEEYDPEAGTIKTISTETASFDGPASYQFDYWKATTDSLKETRTTIVASSQLAVTYPTPYILYQPEYIYQGVLPLPEGACGTSVAPTEEAAPKPSQLPVPPLPTIAPGITDSFGWYHTLKVYTVDETPAALADEPALQSCKPNCPAFDSFLYSGGVAYPSIAFIGPTPQLSTAFVTTCSRSVKGQDGLEACSAVDKAAPGAATITDPPASKPTDENNSSDDNGNQPPAPAPAPGNNQITTTDSSGNPVIVAAPAPGNNQVTTTDESGNTIVVAAQPPSDTTDNNEAPSPAGANLHVTTNAAGQTYIATGGSGTGPATIGSGNAAVAGGQITLTNARGETVVIQGASLVPTGQQAMVNDQDAITVTNEKGELVVVQGGETGTFSIAPNGGGTVLIAGTVTQTSWTDGATITAGQEAESASGQPTGVQNIGIRPGFSGRLVDGLSLTTIGVGICVATLMLLCDG